MSALNDVIATLRALRETSLEEDERRRARGCDPGHLAYAMDGPSLDTLIAVLERTRAELAWWQGTTRRLKAYFICSLILSAMSFALAFWRMFR